MGKTAQEILAELGLNPDGSSTAQYEATQSAGGANAAGATTATQILASLGLNADGSDINKQQQSTPYQQMLIEEKQRRDRENARKTQETQPIEAQGGRTPRAQYNNLVAQRNAIQNRMTAKDPFAAENWEWMNDPEWQKLDAEIKAFNENITESDGSASPLQEQAAAAITGKTPGDTVPKATAQADGAGRSKLNKTPAISRNGRASENEPLHYVAEEDRAYNVETAKAAMEQAEAAKDAAANSYDGRSGKAYNEAKQAYEEAARRYYVLDDSWIDELYAAQGGSEGNSLANLGQQKEQLQAQREELAAQRNNIELGYAKRNTNDISDEEWAVLDKLDTEIAALDAQIASIENDIDTNYDYADYRINDAQQKALEDISEREINALDGTANHIKSLTGHSLEEIFNILNAPEGEEYAALMQELGELGAQQLGGLLETLASGYDKLDKAQAVLGNDSDTFIESMGHAFNAGIAGIRGGAQGTIAWLKEAAIRLSYKSEGTTEEQARLAQLDAQMQDIVTEYGGGMGYESDPRYIALQEEQRQLTAQLQEQRNEYAAQESQDMYSTAQGYLNQRDRLLQQAKQNAGTFQSVAVDLVENATEMLPDTIISVLSAGTGNPGVIACAQNIALALMGVRVFGSENAQLQAEGKGFLERTAYAGVSAGIEIFTEKMFDGLGGIYGKGMVGMEGKELFDIWQDQLIASISDASKRPATAVAASLFFGFLGEGTEEVVSSLCEPITNLIIMDKEEWLQNYGIDESNGWLYDYGKAIENSGEEIGYSFFIGGLMGLFGTVTQIGGTYSEEANSAARERLNEYLSGEVDLAALCTPEMREELRARGIEGDEAIDAFGAAFLEEMKTDGVTAEDVTDNAELWNGMTAAAGVMHPGDTVPKAIAQADGSVSPMQEQAAAAIAPQGTGREAENTPINAVAEADGAGRTFEQAAEESPMQEQAAAAVAPAEQTAQVEQALVASGMAPEQAAQVAQQAATLGQQPAETQREEQAPPLQQGRQSSEIERTVDFSQQSISDIRSYLENNLQQSGGIVGDYTISSEPRLGGGTDITVTDTATGEVFNLQGDGITDEATIAAAIYNNERGKQNVNSGRGNSTGRGHRRQSDSGTNINAGQIQSVSGTAQSIPQQQRAEQRRTKGERGEYKSVNCAELVGEDGSEDGSVLIIPEEDYDEELKAVSEKIQARTGIKPTFVLGPIELYNGAMANGYNSEDAIVVTADHSRFTVEQIAGHESMHAICRKNPKLRDNAIALLKSKLTKGQQALIYNIYNRQYGFLADDAKAETYIWEEVACDYYGGYLNRYGGVKLDEELAGELRDFVDGKPGTSQQSNGTAETTGPPVENVNSEATEEAEPVENVNNTVAESFEEEVAKQQGAETESRAAEREETSPQQKAMLEAKGETVEESKKNTASEETEETDNAALVRQIKNAIPELENMEPVATVTGNEIQKEGRVSDRIWDFVKTIGTIVRKNFGQVEISRGKVKSSFVGHGIGDAKIDIFPAVPKVIESGKQIGFAKNWKGRTYDTYIFAAPVTYKGDRTYVGVIVQKDSNSNRYYLHEVVDENGNIIYENKEAPSSTSDRPSALASDRDTVIDGGASLEEPSSNEIIAPSDAESKGEKASLDDVKEANDSKGEIIKPQNQHSGNISPASGDLRFSLNEAETIEQRSMKYWGSHQLTHISDDMLDAANVVIRNMVDTMKPYLDVNNNKGKRFLPEEILGKTTFQNGSYGKTIENTTICFRTLSYIDFTNEIKEQLGRPLTVEESFLASQMLYAIAKEPQCLYCYVSLDRKAYDEFLLKYTEQRDDAMEKYRWANIDPAERLKPQAKRKSDRSKEKYALGNSPLENIYREYLDGREDSPNQRERFNLWIEAELAGELVGNENLTTEEKRSQIKNENSLRSKQIADAEAYAQGASWAKKLEQYRAYNSDILSMSPNMVRKLNAHYGLRFYSFSEYTPAFIVENMQQIRDASIKGLFGLAYTKKPDFARIFGSTGMNINISCFGRMDNGQVVADTAQGADWDEVKQLREQFPNVGAVFVATNDDMVEWALAQDWIDVVIPFHIVRTGANVAEFYKWVNNTKDQADVDASGKNKTISPAEFHNDRATYERLIQERGLTPRFARWFNNENYMKLVNETRRSDLESSPLKPIFDEDAAKASFNTFVEEGGYYGDWYKEGVDYDASVDEVVNDIKAGRRANEVEYGRQDYDASVAAKFDAATIAKLRKKKGNRQHMQRFSLDEENQLAEVNEALDGKDLIAYHSVREYKLIPALKTGGLPAPSIAITKANAGTGTDYGEISLVFRKGSIDPQMDKRNKIYGADAWTPTMADARIEYSVNRDAAEAFDEKVNSLARDYAGGVADSFYLTTLISDNYGVSSRYAAEDIADRIETYPAVKAAYLADKGVNIEPVYKTPEIKVSPVSNAFAQVAGVDRIADYLMADDDLTWEQVEEIYEMLEEGIRSIYEGSKGNFLVNTVRRNMSYSNAKRYVTEAAEALGNGPETQPVFDKLATQNAIDEEISKDHKGYRNWIAENTKNVIGEGGIQKPTAQTFNASGRRRTWKENYHAATPENIVKAMINAGSRGVRATGSRPSGIQSVAAKSYKSIDEAKADSSRLQRMSESEYSELFKDYEDRISDFISRITEKNSGKYFGDVSDAILEAARGSKTSAAVSKAFADYGMKIAVKDNADLRNLIGEIANMPTDYFEAKPERVVGFDEVAAAVIPDDSSEQLRTALADAGIEAITYEADNFEDRLAKMNSIEGARFSLDDSEYTELAKKPKENEERLQEMVQQAAENAGYDIKTFHGTPNYGFTKFKDGEDRGLIWSTPAREYAENYTVNRKLAPNNRNYNKKNADKVYQLAIKAENMLELGNIELPMFERGTINPTAETLEICEAVGIDPDTLLDEYGRYAHIYQLTKSAEFKQALTDSGYDAVHAKEGGTDGDASTAHWGEGYDTYGVVNGEQLKSMEPVTRNALGRIIPLSKRFNSESKDIRYSLDNGNGVWEKSFEGKANNWEKFFKGEITKEELDAALKEERENPAPGKREWSGVQGLDLGGLTPDQYIEKAMARAAADRADRLRTISRDEFKSTESLERLGVKISGSTGVYERLEMLKQADKMAKRIRKQADKAEKRLKATAAEMKFAKDIAGGLYSREDIPRSMDYDKVNELADWYFAEQGTGSDLITRQKRDIAITLDAKMQQMMNGVDTKKAPKTFRLNGNTPARSMRHIFGDKTGERIYQEIFKPVEENEAERYRFINKQYDDVREFSDSTGRTRPLNKDERKVTQLIVEHQAAAQAVAEMEMGGDAEVRKAEMIKAAAAGILSGDGTLSEAVARALGSKEMADLAKSYAKWQEADTVMQSGKADAIICNTAAEAYKQKFADFYDAINDFLVAHGFEPIGFIKNYAPHMQQDDAVKALQKALDAMGLTSNVADLPTEIAGMTASYKPNKRWNPYFLSRHGDKTKLDIAEAFESYVDYMSDILYHTDDIMRVRAFERYLRRSSSDESIRDNIEMAQALRSGKLENKIDFLQKIGKVGKGTSLTADDAQAALDAYIDEQYKAFDEKTKYGPLAMWLNEYANKLAAKQLNGDRSWEYWYGRRSLNFVNKLQRMFATSQVGGKISSVLNQGAQLPMIYAELGGKYTAQAIGDIMTGKLRRADWAANSDFLVGKKGIDYIVEDPLTMVTRWMFTPAELMDGMVSTIATRGAYLKAINEGMSEREAMQAADKFGSEVMGSRMKGTKPLVFDSKLPWNRILTMFQIEALNTWEHVARDLPRDFREIEEKHGKAKAAQALAGVLLRSIVAAFLLNRLDDELYGGTPAPFDILGLSANFIASGNGLSTNDMLLSIINNAWKKETGEYLFDEDSIFGERGMRYGNLEDGKFSMKAALGDTSYNIMNEVPILSNLFSVLGLGDSTLPLAGLSSAKDAWENLNGLAAGESTYMDVLNSALETGLEFIPGGSQIKRTYQGVTAFAKGGEFDKQGHPKYVVDDDPLTAARMAIFGKYSTPEAQAYYAARDAGTPGGKTLTETQTRNFNAFTDSGYNRTQAMQAARMLTELLDGNSTQEDVAAAIRKMGLPNDLAAAIWQNFGKNWSPKNNPFSKSIGQQVWNELNGGE